MCENEKIAVERINWAHQRQLVMVAILLGLGIGSIEVLSFSQEIFMAIYWILAICFMICFYFIFVFEREIFRWQHKLGSDWKIKFDESPFHYFFDYKNPDMPIYAKVCGILAIILLLYAVVFLGRYSITSMETFDNSSSATLVGFALDLISSSVVYLIQDTYKRRKDKEEESKKTRSALKIEIEQNEKFAQQSFYAPLSTDAWNQAVRGGQALYFDEQLLKQLIILYSMINNRNNLATLYLSKLEDGKTTVIVDAIGQNPEPITKVIKDATDKIVEEIHKITKLL